MVTPYDIAFILLSPVAALLLCRKVSSRVVIATAIACSIAGWLLLLGADAWTDARLAEAFDSIREPSSAQIALYAADGASKAATLLLGLPFSLTYFSLWLLIVRAAKWLFNKVRSGA